LQVVTLEIRGSNLGDFAGSNFGNSR
jgi:hypothetical protein